MTRPITGITKKPTTPRATPNHVVDAGMPDVLRRRLGTAYFTTVPRTSTAVTTAKTVHPVPEDSSSAQTRTAASTSTSPGRIGTSTPTRPTRIARATSTSSTLTAVTIDNGPGLSSGAVVRRRVGAGSVLVGG